MRSTKIQSMREVSAAIREHLPRWFSVKWRHGETTIHIRHRYLGYGCSMTFTGAVDRADLVASMLNLVDDAQQGSDASEGSPVEDLEEGDDRLIDS